MSLYNYVDPLNANLLCCICRAPFTEPTTTLTCAHTFCADCILRALSHAPSCPVDRTPLTPADLGPANQIVRSLVDELRVECVYKAEGCTRMAQRQEMPVHLRDQCEFAEVRCEETGEGGEVCGVSMRRKELNAHQKELHAVSEDDSEETKKDEEKEEESASEQKETHTCPHAALGCPYTGPLKPSLHIPTCPYESLKGFFTANTARISLLTEQNMVLRHKVDSLEHTVQTLRKEMNATKHALGPWFRSSMQAMSGGPSVQDAGGGGIGASAGAYAASSDLPVAGAAGPSSMGTTDEGGDLLAPYFPAEETLRRGQWPASGVVAPLDLGATLEGTLGGLRQSVVGLGAAVDSVGRRGEIALTNETLRLGEELMSVRAQMHGLRMQVHGMMLDRNASLAHMNYASITKL